MEKDRKLLYKEYVNKPQNQYGYGVANGDKDAASMLKISNIALEYGDVVYLVSDGISDYIQFANADKINSMTLEELKLASDEQDVILNKAYSDDKTIIRIRVGA